MIEYEVTMLDEGAEFNWVSDMNWFWMAKYPGNEDFFPGSKSHGGKFTNYRAFTCYYVGYGGHKNTCTRFRRYIGTIGHRPILPEHDFSARNS